jgi:hypothetical protein
VRYKNAKRKSKKSTKLERSICHSGAPPSRRRVFFEAAWSEHGSEPAALMIKPARDEEPAALMIKPARDEVSLQPCLQPCAADLQPRCSSKTKPAALTIKQSQRIECLQPSDMQRL